jgi:hypothetical protein
MLSEDWYPLGFENIVDGSKWQLKWHHYAFLANWGDPNSPFWADTGDPQNLTQGSPIVSPCTQNTHAPDRVVFLAIDWDLLTEQGWMDALEKDLATIKLKYPSVKWIDLMPMMRCPNNQHCNPMANYGPGADADSTREDCYVPPYEDSAIAKVAAAHPDSVGIGPVLTAKACPSNGTTHYGAADNQIESNEVGAFYKVLP